MGPKLRIPGLPKPHVPRPALTAILSRNTARVTVLSGPPGSGKTSLLAEWVAFSHERRFAWLTVDRLDNDPARFWTSVMASLRSHEPGAGVEALDLLPEAGDDYAAFVESLAAELGDLPTPITLILDDVHYLHAGTVLVALDDLVTKLPDCCGIVVATRADPALGLNRLRLDGQLLELRQADLEFSQEEAEEFFDLFDGLRLGKPEVRLLTQQTEGWIAGLKLAALSLRDEADPASFVRRLAGLHPTVVDYLLEEVLDRQPVDIREFLLRTAVLTELNPSLCDTVTGRTDSSRVLRELEAENLFTVPLDPARHTFRYHHLWARLLQDELRGTNPVAWGNAHHAAADWYATAGRVWESLDHLLIGESFHDAIDVLMGVVARRDDAGRTMNVSPWLARFPPGFFDAAPKRVLDLATLLMAAGRYAEVERCLDQVQELLACTPRDLVQRARLAVSHCVCAQVQGDASRCIEWADRSIAWYRPAADLGQFSRIPELLVRSWGWLDDLEAAWAARRRTYALPPAPEAVTRFVTPAILSQLRLLEGDLREADLLADEALACVSVEDGLHMAVAEARLTRAAVLWERNRLGESDREFELALRQAEAHRFVPFAVTALVGLARISAASGRQHEAFERLSLARTANHPLALPQPFASKVDSAEGEVLLAFGAISEAHHLVEHLSQSFQKMLLQTRVALARGNRAAARNLLSEAEPDLDRSSRRLRWWLLDARSRSESSQRSFASALELAARERFVRCFVDEGDELRELLLEWAGSARSQFLEELLAGFEPSEEIHPSGSGGLVDPLTERERTVLGYLPGWCPNDQIAAELYISLNTLKSHLRTIYRKLGVRSRREAVAQARARGLA